jgi:tetratricopeptide (TPR) repeat protein
VNEDGQPEDAVSTRRVSDDAVWRATLSALEGQHAAVPDSVLRASVAHWFDEGILGAVSEAEPAPTILGRAPADRLPGDLLFAAMESLPFVEVYDENRCALHEDVRRVLLAQLLQNDASFVDAGSRAIGEHLRERSEKGTIDFDEALELAYHLLAIGAEDGAEWVEAIFDSSDIAQAAFIDRLMSYVDELRETGRLPAPILARSVVWSVWRAATAGDYAIVARLAEQGRNEAPPHSDLADELGLQLAAARWHLGDRAGAVDLCTDLAARRADDLLGVQALMLLGDMADVTADALKRYESALAQLIVQSGTSLEAPQSFDPSRWLIGHVSEGDESEPAEPSDRAAAEVNGLVGTAVRIGYHDGKDLVLFPPLAIFAEIWLRVGEAEGREGRVANARGWLSLGEALFEVLEDADGFQRTQGAQQRLAGRYGDVERLRELVETQEAMLEWAQSANSVQVELQSVLDLADIYSRLGDLSRAVEYYERGAAIGQELKDLASEAAAAEGLADTAIDRGAFVDADRWLAIAKERYEIVNADSARRLDFVVGKRWTAVGDTSLAQSAYERVLDWATTEDRPDDEAAARLFLARTARSNLDLSEAESQLKAAVKLGSRIDSMLELEVLTEQVTNLHLRQRDSEAAALEEKIEARAAELSLGNMVAWLLYERGETAARRGDLTGAEIAYMQALNRFEALHDESGVFECLIGLVFVLGEAKRAQEELEAARRAELIADAAERSDWEVSAMTAVGTALADVGSPDEAIDTLTEAHRKQPSNSFVCARLGWVCLRADRFEESVGWSRRALKLDPADAYPYRNLGHALLALGKVDEAKAAYAKAIEGRFGDQHFRDELAELELLRRRKPGLAGVDEMIDLFRDEQERVDTAALERRRQQS